MLITPANFPACRCKVRVIARKANDTGPRPLDRCANEEELKELMEAR